MSPLRPCPADIPCVKRVVLGGIEMTDCTLLKSDSLWGSLTKGLGSRNVKVKDILTSSM